MPRNYRFGELYAQILGISQLLLEIKTFILKILVSIYLLQKNAQPVIEKSQAVPLTLTYSPVSKEKKEKQKQIKHALPRRATGFSILLCSTFNFGCIVYFYFENTFLRCTYFIIKSSVYDS